MWIGQTALWALLPIKTNIIKHCQMTMSKIVSWNIAGCHSVVKRKKILTYLKLKKTNFIFIQEMHLNDDESVKLKRDWVGQVYFSTYSNKRGDHIG